MRLYVHQIGDHWAAMLFADAEAPPEPGTLKGIVFFGDRREEAEAAAKGYLGGSALVN